jgi:hypothetical protein
MGVKGIPDSVCFRVIYIDLSRGKQTIKEPVSPFVEGLDKTTAARPSRDDWPGLVGSGLDWT